jgi:uncharacterized protein (DUF342 family)
MEAYLSIYSSGKASLDDIMNDLAAQGVVYGIDQQLLKKLEEDNFPKDQYLIATGLAPVHGENSTTECLITMAPPQSAESVGSSRHFHIRITNVRKGQRLLRRIPATVGISGCNIFGEEVYAKDGENLSLPKGANTNYSDEEENYLIATKDGNFIYDKGQVRVETEYKINGDVSTSNGKTVECYGDLVIQGDIRVGVTIKVDGNLTIMGTVEDATIDCGGNVEIKTGLRGSGIGRLTAYGDISFFHGANYTIISRSSIRVGKIAMSCKLTAKYIDAPRASICGGKIIAFTYIEVLELGKAEYSKTIVEVGGKVNKMRLFGELNKEIEGISDKIELCKDKIKHFEKVIANRQLTVAQEEGIYLFHHTLEVLNDRFERRTKEREQLREELNKMMPKIIVNGLLDDHVKMTINDATIENVSDARNTTFYEKEHEIIRFKNK